MIYKISFTRLAAYDLDEIIDYISLDNRETALKFSHVLKERIKKALGDTPNIGVKYKGSRYLVLNVNSRPKCTRHVHPKCTTPTTDFARL